MTTEPKQTRGGKWESGLCNCGQNCNVCCMSLVAPWWHLYKNTDKLNDAQAPYDVFPTCGTDGGRLGWFYGITFYAEVCYCGSSATSGIVGFIGLLHCGAICMHGVVRRQIREKYAIPPGCCTGCDDCCVALWCYPCSITQEHAQLKYVPWSSLPSAPPKPENFMLPPELTKGA